MKRLSSWGMVFLFCVVGNGVVMIARDVRRAQIAHLDFDFADKIAAFFRGSAWGALFFFALLAAIIGCFLVSFWLENRRWKRARRRDGRRDGRK